MQELPSETIQLIYRVARKLAPRYRFGYHSVEDIVQEAVLLALEVIEKGNYDRAYPLENFLYIHLKNRLFNFKRDNYERMHEPCRNCPHLESCTEFRACPRYLKWRARNDRKKNLMSPIPLEHVRHNRSDESETNIVENVDMLANLERADLLKYIDEHLPVFFRKDYIKFKSGSKLPRSRLVSLIEKLKEILHEYEHEEDHN